MKGVPDDTTNKDMFKNAFGALIKKLGIDKYEKINIAGLPANRANENINSFIGDLPCTYFGFESDKNVYEKLCSLYVNTRNIKFRKGFIEKELYFLQDISVYDLDFCSALLNVEQLEDIIDGIKASRKEDGYVAIQVTFSQRRKGDAFRVEDFFQDNLPAIDFIEGPDKYIGNTAMQVIHIVLKPRQEFKPISFIQILESPKEELTLRELFSKNNLTVTSVSEQYNVHKSTVYQTINRKTPFTRKRTGARLFEQMSKDYNCKIIW